MNLKDLESKNLPFWWVALVELFLFIFAIYFILSGAYIEAILIVILTELRAISWTIKRSLK